MKYSQLHTKTNKSGKDFESINATLLTKAGFIDQTMAGAYSFLPLGLRVLNKIEAIVRDEMDKIGVELVMSSLAPKSLWEITGRLETVDVLMKTVGANQASQLKSNNEYVLNSTQEELITPIAQRFNTSYKDFPFAFYQIQAKFRNEARAKSGLLRGREFRMKDLYSFHTSETDLKAYYEQAKVAYTRVFERLGLGADTVMALASGGDFTKDYSHEFQTRCETGEDILFAAHSANIVFNKEVAPSQAPRLTDTQEPREMEEVEGTGIIGVEALAEYLKIPVEKTTKTILFETAEGNVIAAAVRGGYDINEEKLKKVVGTTSLQLASAETVKRVTGAEVGYAGVLNLPSEVKVFFDESTQNRINFECGANRTNYHSINVNFGRDLPMPEQFYDFKTAKEGDAYPETGEVYEVFRAAEVGNIFPLNTKFTKAFGYTFTDEQGQEQPVYMGCYGIGTTRVMGVLVEKYHDERGIIWPSQVAPFAVHLVSLKGAEAAAQQTYDQLQAAGIEVLWDDRDVSPGVKFTDADLIGIPVRLVVSMKTGDKVEWKNRAETATELLEVSAAIARIQT